MVIDFRKIGREYVLAKCAEEAVTAPMLPLWLTRFLARRAVQYKLFERTRTVHVEPINVEDMRP